LLKGTLSKKGFTHIVIIEKVWMLC